MPRIRSIKPQFFTHEELSALPPTTHLLAAGLLCYADDEGYFNANPALVRAAIFPVREGSLKIHDMLSELSNVGYIRLGKGADGRTYGHIINFAEHQRVNRPNPSKIKDLEISWEGSLRAHGMLTEDSVGEEGIRNKEKGIREGERKGARPLPDEFVPNDAHIALSEAEGINLRVEFQKFCDYCKANNRRYTDWDAALRNWIRKAAEISGTRQPSLLPRRPVMR